MTPRRNVETYLPMADALGRALLWGILQYNRSHDRWFLHERSVEDLMQPHRRSARPDGIIAMVDSEETLTHLAAQHIPFVAVFRREFSSDCCRIVYKHYEIGEKIACYFANLGFQDVAFFSMKTGLVSPLRQEGFCHTSKQKGKTVHIYDDRVIAGNGDTKNIVHWLEDLPKPVAIMAHDDRAAKVLLEGCFQAGLRIPDDVAVAGVDNDVLICGFTRPPLSSLELNHNEAGFQAAHLLENAMEGRLTGPTTITIEPNLMVVRQSTDILAISDPEVAAAVKFIRDRCHQPLQVADVMEHVNASQPTLVNRFKLSLGRTISEEIASARAQRIGHMLCETDMTIGQIAKAMGYASDKHLARVFRRFTGMTPTQYRRRHAKKELP